MSKSGIVNIMALAALCAWPCKGMAQQRDSGPDPMIALPAGSMRLDSLENKIARQSGFIFSFDATTISPSKKIALPPSPVKLKVLLLYLENNNHLASRIYGNHVIIHQSTLLKAPSPRDIQDNGKHQPLHEKEIKPVKIPKKIDSGKDLSVRQANPRSKSILPPIKSGISLKTAAVPLPPAMHGPERSTVPVKPFRRAPALADTKPAPSPILVTGHHKDKKQHKSGIRIRENGSKFFAAAGLTGGESLYISPEIKGRRALAVRNSRVADQL